MKFNLSEYQALLRQSTRDFLTSECPIDRARKVMEDDPQGYESAEWARLAEMGYLGLTLPANVGGQDLGAIELAIVLEEMGRACMPGPYLDAVLAASLLAAAGGQDALLKTICAGKQLVTIARADAPYAGEAPASVRVDGDRVHGSKYFIPFAAQADALVVTAPDGIYLVDGPFSVTALPTFDLAQRFAARLDAAPDFELAVEPEANIVCFRHVPFGVPDLDPLQERIRQRLLANGSFYLVQTRLRGRLFLRATLINPLTTDHDLAALLDAIRQHG